MKKFLLLFVVVIITGIGILFFLKGEDQYDASKYLVTLSDGLKSGSTIDYTLPDQFDTIHTLDESVHKLIMVFSKEKGHMVKEFLENKPIDYLKNHQAAFVADVSAMPVVIRNTFALPDLKKHSYSVVLIYDKNISDRLKQGIDTESITLIQLDKKKIVSIKRINNIATLEEALR